MRNVSERDHPAATIQLGAQPHPDQTAAAPAHDVASRTTGQRRPSAGQEAVLLTDLLTRPRGTGETKRNTGDGGRPRALVSETYRHAGDEGDARRMAHNPATTGTKAGASVIYALYWLQSPPGTTWPNGWLSRGRSMRRSADVLQKKSTLQLVRSTEKSGALMKSPGRCLRSAACTWSGCICR